MLLNGFSVRIPEGSEKEASGYVEMKHGTQYTLQLRNQRNIRCDAEVTIDGKHVGTFRLERYGQLRLERSADDNRRFTFYLRDSEEGEAVELDQVSKGELGLVQVCFKPERQREVVVKNDPWVLRRTFGKLRDSGDSFSYDAVDDDFDGARGLEAPSFSASTYGNDSKGFTLGSSKSRGRSAPDYQAGGTGMSGHSNQSFTDVAPLDYDYEQETTISLRLVASKRTTPGPLKPVQKSNPIPPPVWII